MTLLEYVRRVACSIGVHRLVTVSESHIIMTGKRVERCVDCGIRYRSLLYLGVPMEVEVIPDSERAAGIEVE